MKRLLATDISESRVAVMKKGVYGLGSNATKAAAYKGYNGHNSNETETKDPTR